MHRLLKGLKNRLRLAFMPGADIFTRRRERLSLYWKNGRRRVLDAGCGNGWFTYLAYGTGAEAVGVNFDEGQVRKAKEFYNEWMRIPEHRLKFLKTNLYELDSLEPGFDEIICYETLEHVKRDDEVCRSFYRLLRPGGFLHLCCPNAEHPKWANETLDLEEKGYHVRAGYTLESYKKLLEPIGFSVTASEGVGGRALVAAHRTVDWFRRRIGDAASLPVVMLAEPFVRLDPNVHDNPFCLYVKAVK